MFRTTLLQGTDNVSIDLPAYNLLPVYQDFFSKISKKVAIYSGLW